MKELISIAEAVAPEVVPIAEPEIIFVEPVAPETVEVVEVAPEVVVVGNETLDVCYLLEHLL